MNRIAAILFIPVLLLCVSSARAQQPVPSGIIPCGFGWIMQYYQQHDPTYKERVAATFALSQETAAKTTGQVFYIPVVFHVIYKTAAQNLHDSVILNQLNILNDAFRKRHSDTGDIRSIFKPLSTDAEIEFYLATQDPQGMPTNGINRVQTTRDNWGDIFALFTGDYSWLEDIKTTANDGYDPWPTSRYMNVWIADMTDANLGSPFLMGIATPPVNPLPANWPPGAFPPLKDGVVLQTHAVGSNNPHASVLTSMGYADDGRTAVHEVGHYLGLRHIWGDPDPGQSCTATGDDGIADTPAQAEPSNSTGSCPAANTNTCTSGSPDLPDMWENYMDYSHGSCQRLFTPGQVAHMRSILSNQRDTLVGFPMHLIQLQAQPAILTVYPQPASGQVSIRFSEATIQHVHIRNMFGQVVKTWTKTDAAARQYDISDLPSGQYLITVQGQYHSHTQRLSVLHTR